MDEADVIVEFELPDGETTWRNFQIDVGPDDTLASISNRLSEIVEDYVNGVSGKSDAPAGIEPLLGPGGMLTVEVLTWPEF